MKDYILTKAASDCGSVYAQHQRVYALTEASKHNERVLFRDDGDALIVRSVREAPGAVRSEDVVTPANGSLCVFSLDACVEKKRTRGFSHYPAPNDRKSREDWLVRKAEASGFQLLDVVITAGMLHDTKQSGESIVMDATKFTGVLRVADATKLRVALENGVGRKGKAFGLGMLRLETLVDAAVTREAA